MKTMCEVKTTDGKLAVCSFCVGKVFLGFPLFHGSTDVELTLKDILKVTVGGEESACDGCEG